MIPRTRRTDDTPQKIGNDLETYAASRLNGSQVVQSGAGKFLKLDVSDRARFVLSCKASRRLRDTALRAIWNLWLEAMRGARGFAGHGDGAKPGMVFEINGEVLILIRLDDYADAVTGDAAPYIPPDKAQERRMQARRSRLG